MICYLGQLFRTVSEASEPHPCLESDQPALNLAALACAACNAIFSTCNATFSLLLQGDDYGRVVNCLCTSGLFDELHAGYELCSGSSQFVVLMPQIPAKE